MKRSVIFFSLIIICLAATTTAYGQKGCELKVVGTWKAAGSDGASPVFYRFGPDTTLTVLSPSGQGSELKEIASAVYTFDNPKAPKVILVKAEKEGGGFTKGITSIEISGYDDTSLTLVKPGSGQTRWVKVDPHRYYLVLAGRIGIFYDGSGPTFSMVVKTDGEQTQIDALGIYDGGGKWAFGPIPVEVYKEFMKEPAKGSDVLLRLEITAAQYERSLNVVKTWERRVRNNELLYPDLTMDNILVAKQVTETLNLCGERFKLHKLDWSLDDHISHAELDDPPRGRIPYMYFKELKRLNQSAHVPDEKFYEHVRMAQK
ncbi:MAG TPA: hypothetical protein VFQ92_21025 [Blastocatellia bacterium]|nr:hypothetical protein [Blastocatellia bacterium]